VNQLYAKGLFQDEVVLVTGGGTGIGACVAEEVGRLGAKVAICGRRPEPLAERAAQLERDFGIEVHHATCDIRDPDAVDAYVASVVERFGRIDALVNNAGGQFPSPALTMSPRGFEAVVKNNLLGTFHMTQAVAKQAMVPAQQGRILNVIAQIVRGFPGMSHTGAARAGVENMTKSLAIEWSQHGLRVNCIAPGVIETSGTRQYPPELLRDAAKANPLRRLGAPEEVAHLITYMISRYADFITGQTFVMDGGACLWGDQWPIPEVVPKHAPYLLGSEKDED